MCGVCDMWIVISCSGVSRERNPHLFKKKRERESENTGGQIIFPNTPSNFNPPPRVTTWCSCCHLRFTYIGAGPPPLLCCFSIQARHSPPPSHRRGSYLRGRPISITPQPPLLHYKEPGQQGLAVRMEDNGIEVVLKSQRTTAAK